MNIGIVMWICGILFIALITCVLWAMIDMSARNDGEYHKCNAKVKYIYNQSYDYDSYEWLDEDKENVLIHAFRKQSAPHYCQDGQTFTCELHNITVLETKGELIWEDS